jgi:hypothetical protein
LRHRGRFLEFGIERQGTARRRCWGDLGAALVLLGNDVMLSNALSAINPPKPRPAAVD